MTARHLVHQRPCSAAGQKHSISPRWYASGRLIATGFFHRFKVLYQQEMCAVTNVLNTSCFLFLFFRNKFSIPKVPTTKPRLPGFSLAFLNLSLSLVSGKNTTWESHSREPLSIVAFPCFAVNPGDIQKFGRGSQIRRLSPPQRLGKWADPLNI